MAAAAAMQEEAEGEGEGVQEGEEGSMALDTDSKATRWADAL